MTILVAILAVLVLIAPVTNFVGTAAQVVQTADEVQDWRLKGCPERRLDHTVVYKCQTPTPAPKKHVVKKHVVPLPTPQPPVYVQPPLPEVPAEQLAPPAPPPAKYDLSVQWGFDHLFAVLLTFAAFGVIGHGLRRIYRMWKGLE